MKLLHRNLSVGLRQVGVAGELRQTTAVRHLERDSAQADDRLALAYPTTLEGLERAMRVLAK